MDWQEHTVATRAKVLFGPPRSYRFSSPSRPQPLQLNSLAEGMLHTVLVYVLNSREDRKLSGLAARLRGPWQGRLPHKFLSRSSFLVFLSVILTLRD